MYYFLTHKLYSPISAIEKMMCTRLQLFEAHGVQARIVTRNFTRRVAPELVKQAVDRGAYLNLYDYLQGVDRQAPSTTFDPLTIPHDTVKTTAQGEQIFLLGGSQVANVTFAEDHAVNYIRHYSATNRQLWVDFYDADGWLSMTQQLDDNGRITQQQFWTPDHRLAYQETYGLLANGSWGNLDMAVVTPQGYHHFSDMDTLFAWYLDRLAEADPAAVFVSDRHEASTKALTLMTVPAKKAMVLHSAQTVDPLVPTSPIAPFIQLAADHHFAAFITSTREQMRALRERIPNYVTAVPVRYLTAAELARPHVPLADRAKHRILVVARLSVEKRVGEVIAALPLIQQQVPDASVWIYGAPMAGHEEEKRLHQQVTDLKLGASVHFAGFKDSLDDIYPAGQVLAVTSQYEGFNIAMLEALSYGVPVVSYDVPYGARAMITPHGNGELVTEQTPAALAAAIVPLLTDEDKWAGYSIAAYASAQRFSARRVWRAWGRVIDHLGQPAHDEIPQAESNQLNP